MQSSLDQQKRKVINSVLLTMTKKNASSVHQFAKQIVIFCCCKIICFKNSHILVIPMHTILIYCRAPDLTKQKTIYFFSVSFCFFRFFLLLTFLPGCFNIFQFLPVSVFFSSFSVSSRSSQFFFLPVFTRFFQLILKI